MADIRLKILLRYPSFFDIVLNSKKKGGGGAYDLFIFYGLDNVKIFESTFVVSKFIVSNRV